MTILMILKLIATGDIKNSTRLYSTSINSDDLYVYRNKIHFIDQYDNIFELYTDDIIELIEDNTIFIKGEQYGI